MLLQLRPPWGIREFFSLFAENKRSSARTAVAPLPARKRDSRRIRLKKKVAQKKPRPKSLAKTRPQAKGGRKKTLKKINKKTSAKKKSVKKSAKKVATKKTSAQKTKTQKDQPRLWLVDGSGYIFRAFYAIPTRMTRDKTPVNAVFGFTNMLLSLRQSVAPQDCITVVFDAGSHSFRNEIYADYKANRDETPPDLIPQFAPTREAARALGLPVVEQPEVEADDLIASYARLAEAQKMEAVIVSSDKDLMQLVRPGVSLWDPMKEKTLGEAEVFDKFGVAPNRVADVQALAGDASDNVPGVPGIGVKTAALLINQYGDLESVLAQAGEIQQPKRREALITFADQARLCLRLVRLAEDVALPLTLDQLHGESRDPDLLRRFLEKYEFRSILARLERTGELDPATTNPAESLKGSAKKSGETTPEGYALIQDEATLAAWLTQARGDGLLCLDTETTDLNPERARLVGVALGLLDGRAGYIPIAHRTPAGTGEQEQEKNPTGKKSQKKSTTQTGLFQAEKPTKEKKAEEREESQENALLPNQLTLEKVRTLLSPVLTDPSVLKIGHNLKYDLRILQAHGMELVGLDDTLLLSYVLDAGTGSHALDALSKRHLDKTPIAYAQVTKPASGRKQLRFDEVALDKACAYAAEDADMTLQLWQRLRPRLASEKRTRVYETLERPLVPVLAEMEANGILLDADTLRTLSEDFHTRAHALEAECHQLAGRAFALGSPKQLGVVLFDELDLPHGGRTGKSGVKSTDHAVLEDLAAQGFAIAEKVLAWRSLTKLRSTYTEALLDSMEPSGRVHTHFGQTGAATGRLSSSNPNLQNIPIRTADGRRIREAFVAGAGQVLLSVDYSQIELRLAAEITDEPALKRAFAEGADIHAATAAEMFHLDLDKVSKERRHEAKAINFGIIYGISPFGLARGLKISQEEARTFMDTYFARYPQIANWMEATRKEVRQTGQVETLFGRVIHLPAIRSNNHQQRAFAERAAINAPIQGTAADIIKRAMIRLPMALRKAGLSAKLLLQVHDELVLEVPEGELNATSAVVTEIMETAPLPACPLSTPLIAEAKSARTWGQAH